MGKLILLFLVLFPLEAKFPLRPRRQTVLKRAGVNLALSAVVFLAGFFIVRPLALRAIGWADFKNAGLLRFLPLTSGGNYIAGFLLMDLSFYYWHRINHTAGFFRRFHRVHHIDPELDIFTSFRFHFGEILYSAGFRVLQVILIGVSLPVYLAYEISFVGATMFHHSDLRLPLGFERVLNKIIVTPRMHGIHHSILKRETNSNYSVIFSCWDRLNDSLRLNVAQSEIDIGVIGYQRQEDNDFLNLLKVPFVENKTEASLRLDMERNMSIKKTLMLE